MKHIPLHITVHDVDVSSRLRELLQTKVAALARFAGDILTAEVVVRGPTGAAQLFSLSARLALPGRDVQANATHAVSSARSRNLSHDLVAYRARERRASRNHSVGQA